MDLSFGFYKWAKNKNLHFSLFCPWAIHNLSFLTGKIKVLVYMFSKAPTTTTVHVTNRDKFVE